MFIITKDDRRLDKSILIDSHSGIFYSSEKRLIAATNSGQKQNQTKYYLVTDTFVEICIYTPTHTHLFQENGMVVVIFGE